MVRTSPCYSTATQPNGTCLLNRLLPINTLLSSSTSPLFLGSKGIGLGPEGILVLSVKINKHLLLTDIELRIQT